jgi:hypothetical protein
VKTIAPAAMAAIEAGEAIVTGAVEIIPRQTVVVPPSVDWSTVDTIDVAAVANGATGAVGGLAAGVLVGGFDPTDLVRVSLPAGETYTAWNFHDGDADGWYTQFRVIPDESSTLVFWVAGSGGGAHATAAAARAAFGTAQFTGHSSYRFYIEDYPPDDDTGGVSILIEKGVASEGVTVGSGDPIRLWGGYGPREFAGETYQGVGDRGLAQQTAGVLGGVAQGMTLSLSGIEPGLLELLDASEIKGASVVLRRLIFARRRQDVARRAHLRPRPGRHGHHRGGGRRWGFDQRGRRKRGARPRPIGRADAVGQRPAPDRFQ